MRDAMKNIIEFYYNITDIELHNRNDYYFFSIGKRNFIFKLCFDSEERVSSAYKIGRILSNQEEMDNIILNKFNSPLTRVQNDMYILMEKKRKDTLSLREITKLANIRLFDRDMVKGLERNNWEILWENKIDYYERQVNENKKKYPLIRESFDYFVGMGENAISYLVNTKLEVKSTFADEKGISHNSLSDSLYDPLNIILDHKARDLAEYIKLAFWERRENIIEEMNEYFKYNYYSVYGIRVLFARVLYPSFYFNMYDLIIMDKISENNLNKIIERTGEYENYLYNIYLYLRKYYDIPLPEWLKKRGL